MYQANAGGGKRRVLNYGIPYIVFSFIWWLSKMIFSSHTNTQLSLVDLLWIPLYPISFMWFIYALLVMIVIQTLWHNKLYKYRYIHIGFAMLLFAIQPILAEKLECISFKDLIISDISRNYIFFLTGVYFGKYLLNWGNKGNVILKSIFTGVVIIFLNYLVYHHIIYNDFILKIVLAILGTLFLLSIGGLIQNQKWICYIGKVSLSIYVLQGIAISVSRQLLQKVYFFPDDYEVIPLALCTTLGTLIPIGLYLLSSKIWKLDFVFHPCKYIQI